MKRQQYCEIQIKMGGSVSKSRKDRDTVIEKVDGSR